MAKAVNLLFCLMMLISSCDILRDSPYDVLAWTPGEGFHSNPGRIIVSVLLSHESDRVKTEQAFSLTEDGKTMKGNFFWDGSRLNFLPASPLEADHDYQITLGTGAQNNKGISLERKFEAFFSTRPPGARSAIIRTEPAREGSIPDNRGEFRIFFSAPVRLESCMDSVSFNPSTPGSWRLEDGSRTACFTPRDPWQPGILYRVKVDSGFAGISGEILGSEYNSVFSAGDDGEKPVLLKANALFPSVEEIPVEKIPPGMPGYFSLPEFYGWEAYTRLEFVFSEPVDLGGLRSLLAAEPSAALLMETAPEFSDRAVFRFAEFPPWGSSFLFRLGSGIKDRAGNGSEYEYLFRIICSGPYSKPPALTGIRLPLSPGNAENQRPVIFSPGDVFKDLPIEIGEGNYPFGERIPSWIELYFESAPETEIDPFSVMDLFRVETTNQALAFSPRSVIMGNFSRDPEPLWENFQRVEIQGFLTNSVHTGIVTFRIPPGLTDKRGNRSSVDFRISLSK